MNRMDEIKNLFGGTVGGEIVNTIKLKCPTTKFNLNAEDKYHIIGMGMMIEKDLENTLKLDLENLRDDTILCFDRHQILEALGIIDGALNLLTANKIMEESDGKSYIDKVIDFLNRNPIVRYDYFKRYIPAKQELKEYGLPTPNAQRCINRFIFLVQNIWFVTYGDLDHFYEKIVEAFKTTGDDENENSGKDN